MNKRDIETLFRYTDWANARVLRQAAQVSPEQYTAAAPVPQGSLRGALVHTLAAEVTWCGWHLMAHVVIHGTQHRSEAAILLTSAGHSPGELDLIGFLREKE